MPRTKYEFDAIVIGAGTAGLSALKEASKHSQNILLIHDGPTGTTCARVGCMPSKSLIHAAKLYDSRKKMEEAGIEGAEQLSANLPKILEQVRKKRDYFVSSVEDGMEPYAAHIIHGKARLESPTSVRADGRLLHAKNIIIATGSSPIIPKEYQDFESKIITTDNLFEQKDLPKRIAVMGLGVVGLEMAQALAKLGVEVTAIDKNSQVGGLSDTDICNKMIEVLKKDMRVWLNTEAEVAHKGEALLVKGNDEMIEVDALLMAVGRKPNTGSLGFKRLKIPTDSSGVPHFNNYTMQVPNHPIFLAGDVTDERTVLHEAADEGKRAAYHAMTGKQDAQPRMVPLSIVFSEPNIAIIGESHYGLRRVDTIIGEASFEDQGRATLENKNAGKIRIMANKADGRIMGCELMVEGGEHLAHLIALAIERSLTAVEMLEMPFYHPTLEEGVKTALKSIQQQISKKAA